MKAAQMGLTSKAMLRAIYSERYNNYRGILYLFPNKTDVTDFSKGRVDPLIDENPETIGRWIRDNDAANIKRVWNCFLYLRGMTSRVGLKSIPVDFIIFDELDEAPQNAVDMAMERMGYSVYQEVSKLSNPTLPDYGIDKAFQETDQRYWLLKCERCG
jgi:phage terminase large subunit GpA-like protein